MGNCGDGGDSGLWGFGDLGDSGFGGFGGLGFRIYGQPCTEQCAVNGQNACIWHSLSDDLEEL